jgi:hypothetical protein
MAPERKPHIPEWARRERLADLAWIAENMQEFWAAAQRGFAEFGRGAIAVDTTAQPDPRRGNPMYYLPQEQLPSLGIAGEDEIRMVAEYEPAWQFVAMLIKEQNRVSSYQVGVPDARSKTDGSASSFIR